MGSTREIPATALAIKVTNVSSPSYMKIYNEDGYTERLNYIGNQLRVQMKPKRRKKINCTTQPQLGDVVIMHNRLETELELPAWWIRGVLEFFNEKTLQYDVFLVDHGYTIKASREDFTIISKSLIPDEYLTFTVGLYNVIPALHKSEIVEVNMEVSRKWTDRAVEITRDAISASSKLYFDYLAVNETDVKYGEMYLVLDNDIVSLSEILVSRKCAIYLGKEFLSLVRGRNRSPTKTISSVDGGVVLDLEVSNLDPPRQHHVTAETTTEEKETKTPRGTSGLVRKSRLIRYIGEDCHQILVHSNIQCDRLVSIEDARFPPKIHAALKKLEIIALRRIQSYVWPAINKGLNVLAVGPPSCGKTIGHVLPIVSSIASWKTVPKGNNPSVLILCSSTSDVLSVRSLCSELLEVYTDIRCVAGWNGRPNRSLVADIYNGCQILVATPAFLVRFINQDADHKKLINFENLRHLVIDGIDVVLSKYYEPLKILFNKHVSIGNKESENLDKQPIQIVAVARHWSSLVAEFAKQLMTEPFVCIGSYMEAAIFGRIKPKLIYSEAKNKIEKVTELLGEQVSMIKTVIICANSKEAREVHEYISKTKKTLVACEQMIFTEIHGVRECWKAAVSGLYPVLICTDEVLVDLNITDVDWLIHYSVALPSKTQFYFRFSTIMNNLRKGKGNCKVTIIFDETNEFQLYGLVSVVKRCGTNISRAFMDVVMQTAARLDGSKKMHPICDNVKAFGFCAKKNSCPYRHCVLGEVDTPKTSIKIGDSVKLTVTYVHNATHFTARIMEYISPEKEITKYSAKEYMRMSSTIQTYYADKSKRRCHRRIKVGDICAVEESLDNFQRVKVLNIVEKDYENVPIAVELKCIDTGAILTKISVTRLMEIPEDLANRDTHILEVFLVGLAPYDDEYEWNFRAIEAAHSWFPDKSKPNSFVLGKVRLHLADTLWVDPLEIRTPIIGHPELISGSLKRQMLKLNHATLNEKHLPKLFELCRIGMVRNAEGELIGPETGDTSENELEST